MSTVIVTGGAGFIGVNLIRRLLRKTDWMIVNVDALTYAGNLESLADVAGHPRYIFARGDIVDGEFDAAMLKKYAPNAVINLAAESHVDRSIIDPYSFLRTNVEGSFRLLESVRAWLPSADARSKSAFRFLHVSTDEVFGSLEPEESAFTETSPFRPNSPYSATKAASEHLVRAYHHTYGLPTLVTNCSNNYGPYQFPEKLIPLMIGNAIAGRELPIYGDGHNVRDWLYVDDHCDAILAVLNGGRVGESYNVGGSSERSNNEVVNGLCDILDRVSSRSAGVSYRGQVRFVKDRPGHDRRYAVDAAKIRRELGWSPSETFQSGLEKTVHWYLNNAAWSSSVVAGTYRSWIEKNYENRGKA